MRKATKNKKITLKERKEKKEFDSALKGLVKELGKGKKLNSFDIGVQKQLDYSQKRKDILEKERVRDEKRQKVLLKKQKEIERLQKIKDKVDDEKMKNKDLKLEVSRKENDINVLRNRIKMLEKNVGGG